MAIFKLGGNCDTLYHQAKTLDLNFKLIDIQTNHLSPLNDEKRRNLRALECLRKKDDPNYDSEDELIYFYFRI
jgi:hypothetical protein